MTEQQIRKWKTVYGICLSILTAIVGVLFIIQTWSIFLSAEKSPYTPQIIGEKFLQILLPICIWILGIVGGVVLHALFPDAPKSLKGYVASRTTLARLQMRLCQNEGGMSALNKEKTFRTIVWSVCALVCGAMGVLILWTLLDKAYTPWLQASFFTAHGAVADRLVKICFYLVVVLLVCITTMCLDEYSVKKQTSMVKEQIAENAKQGKKLVVNVDKKSSFIEKLFEKYPILQSIWWKKGLQIGLFAVGIALFIIGIANGGMTDVFEKARNICTQCIGLG